MTSKRPTPPAEGGSYVIGKDGKRVREAFTEERGPGARPASADIEADAEPAPRQLPADKPIDAAAKPVKGA
jgi:hypothetical protein